MFSSYYPTVILGEIVGMLHRFQLLAYELLEQQVQFNREGEVPPELIGLEVMIIIWMIRVHGTKRFSETRVLKVLNSLAKMSYSKFEENCDVLDASHSEMHILSSTSSALQQLKDNVTFIQEEGAEESSTKIVAISKTGE